MPRQSDDEEPTAEELIEALQHVNDALHRLGGAWQLLPGNVRARLVMESQRIENLLDRAGALPLPPPRATRDRLIRHLPVPKPSSHLAKSALLGKARRLTRTPTI
jgi:beta-phosphoglucomutase-like phosphatase (HAD superfamily)